ncbi:MAG: flagellar motor protein MotB [Phycisphaerae bacterium]|jgi:hypothetical protein
MSGKHQQEESGGEGVGLWYISFADMITLLLSFFVMLTTFSSFDDGSMSKLEGVMESVSQSGIFGGRRPRDSMVAPVENIVDWTAVGSEKPTDHDGQPVQHPPESNWVSMMAEAYNNRRLIRIPSEDLFFGEGTHLTPAGRSRLKLLGTFARMVPCRVIVGESALEQNRQAVGRSLQRAWAVTEFLTQDPKLPQSRFSLNVAPSDSAEDAGGRKMMEIALIAGEGA